MQNRPCPKTVLLLLATTFGVLFPRPGAAQVQLLQDPGFELSANNGTFPSSGAWDPLWYPDLAGAGVTSTAARAGNCGLWAYTAAGNAGFSWSGTAQQFPAGPGEVYTARAWVRSAPSSAGGSWIGGSKACVRLEFLNLNNEVIAYYDSPAITTANSAWAQYSVRTPVAPAGTSILRLLCYVEKPDNGTPGQSIANFDDCYLELTATVSRPELSVSPVCLGIAKAQTQKSFKVANVGTIDLNWQVQSAPGWITTINPPNGVLGPNAEQTVTLTISRAGLTQPGYKGTLRVASNGGARDVTVYLDQPVYSVPTQPSLVTVSGRQLLVRRRLPNGLLEPARPWTVKGVGWSPAGIGNPGDLASRRSEFAVWYVADVALIKELNANTVYTFLDFGSGTAARDILDYLYKNGIMAIMTVDEGTNNTANLATLVNTFKNHPAILMWALGNEWNLNYYHGKFGSPSGPNFAQSLQAAAAATQAAAQQLKQLDANHPVISIFGELDLPGRQQPLSVTQQLVNATCGAVDVWGLNIYRGASFGSLFAQWQSITARPLMLSEFGTDSYRTNSWWPVVGRVDEDMQQSFDGGLWREIASQTSAENAQRPCVGGTVFEWSDEWWKVQLLDGGSNVLQDNGGFATTWNRTAHPDGFANEEYFGLVDIDRRKKWSYYTLQKVFGFLNAASHWEEYR